MALASVAIRGGADVLQFRDKTASDSAFLKETERLLSVTRRAGVPLIINDRVEIACVLGADGVHLGQEDLPIAAARRVLGSSALIGRSTHSLEQARAAEAEGASYIGCGPIFPTPTKPDYGSVGLELIGHVLEAVRIPVVCIGGIDAGTIESVLRAGATRIAVVRAVCAAADPESAARNLKQTLVQFRREGGNQGVPRPDDHSGVSLRDDR
jgi:thiamine-phosphate pyrophosphorylase